MMFSASIFGLTVLAIASRCLAQDMNCVLTVPPNPLTAEGLATPYKMTGCNQINFGTEGCFVEASILDPATGAITVYNPLVINQDQAVAGVDFITPVVPTLPANAVVGIWFGSNALTLTLAGSTNGCVNGDGNSIFGQFAYCNAPEFFTAAETAVAAGLLKIPPPGSTTKAATVQPCPVVRDFRVVDMDQSDNVDTTYLLINGKTLAQNTPANAAANKNATELSNGSDNALVNDFLAPTLGCTPFTMPSITNPNGVSASLALNELQSQYFPPAAGPALVPLNDDFTVINNNGNVMQSLAKTNLYRAGVGQPQAADLANASGTTYCMQYAASGIFIALNEALFTGATSPAPAASNSLFTFLANRFATSFGPVPSLGCVTLFGLNESPVNQTVNGDCIVTAATINTKVLQDILDGVIKPVAAGGNGTAAAGPTAAGSSSTTAVLAASTVAAAGNLSTTAQLLPTTNLAISLAASTPANTPVSAVAATSAAAAPTVVATTTIVEVVTFFDFVLSLGGLPPAVTSGENAFVVLEEVFEDLASAASAACGHQFTTCSGLAGAAFGVEECTTQMNSCQGAASTATPTASTPTTLTATATVPTTVTPAATAVATSAAPAPAVTTAAAVAQAVGAADVGAGVGAASAPVTSVSISMSISMVTVTVTEPCGSAAVPTMKNRMVRRQITHW